MAQRINPMVACSTRGSSHLQALNRELGVKWALDLESPSNEMLKKSTKMLELGEMASCKGTSLARSPYQSKFAQS